MKLLNRNKEFDKIIINTVCNYINLSDEEKELQKVRNSICGLNYDIYINFVNTLIEKDYGIQEVFIYGILKKDLFNFKVVLNKSNKIIECHYHVIFISNDSLGCYSID